LFWICEHFKIIGRQYFNNTHTLFDYNTKIIGVKEATVKEERSCIFSLACGSSVNECDFL
jgi:hypothetical protein